MPVKTTTKTPATPKRTATKPPAKTTKRTSTRSTTAKKPAAKKPAPKSQASSMAAKRDQQTIKLELNNELLRHKLSLSSGQALPRDQVQEEIETANGIVRNSLALLHKTLPKKLLGLNEREMALAIKQQIEAIQTQLCDEIESAPP